MDRTYMSAPEAQAKFRRAARLCLLLAAAIAASVSMNLWLAIRLIDARHDFRKATDPAVQTFQRMARR